ncbi:uncharacterized protein BXZ73DRAFT_97103 [Epithele typhae]|uniref:uncharacterized protein n=1 Tax=Epithele typhae TaxID=378194 RepID=UPI002007F961|nr:uncharacterized protein BXZ73DRAFT_97103 [Epithele typhae]KAH9943042.1 hypothetical protein BXZ73DRAFT_97103 [Epithele typhae]
MTGSRAAVEQISSPGNAYYAMHAGAVQAHLPPRFGNARYPHVLHVAAYKVLLPALRGSDPHLPLSVHLVIFVASAVLLPMPRLFPSLGRSSKEHASAYAGYDTYDAPHGYYDDHGYDEQAPPSSAWRRVFAKKPSKKKYIRPEQVVPYATPQEYRATIEHWPEEPNYPADGFPDDEDSSYEHLLQHGSRPRPPESPPLVERESTLDRIGQAFGGPDPYAPTPIDTVPSGSRGAPFYAPQPPPSGPPHVAVMSNMRQRPTLPEATGWPTLGDENGSIASHPDKPGARSSCVLDKPLDPREEPPVVVVVEQGKNGKRDKYYIIPGGAPVIFEDAAGNELTRVGDFSGRYRPPTRPRPVIVQDQFGREICRAGFNNDDRVSVGSRSVDDYSESGRSYQRGRPAERTPVIPGTRTAQLLISPVMTQHNMGRVDKARTKSRAMDRLGSPSHLGHKRLLPPAHTIEIHITNPLAEDARTPRAKIWHMWTLEAQIQGDRAATGAEAPNIARTTH